MDYALLQKIKAELETRTKNEEENSEKVADDEEDELEEPSLAVQPIQLKQKHAKICSK